MSHREGAGPLGSTMSDRAPDLTVTRAELLARVASLRTRMADAGLDALLLATGDNLRYASGYPSPMRSGPRPFLFLLPLESAPVFIVHTGRESEARLLSWADDVRTYYRLSRAPVSLIAEAVRDRGLANATIGVEIGVEQCLDIPFTDFVALRAALPHARFVDSASVLWAARARKSKLEIARIRRACEITSAAFEGCFPLLEPGMPERTAAHLMSSTMIELGAEETWLLMTSGQGNYDLVSRGPWPRQLQREDMVYVDMGCCVSGYWCDFDRSGVIGGPTSRQLAAQEHANQATALGVSMVEPGANTRDIARACGDAIGRFPFPITSDIGHLAARVGHGIGLAPVEPPNITDYENTVLAPGMIITIEPGVATAFGVFHVEQNVLVTADGHEVLSTAPTEIWEIPG
jgi:Xaa-Pro aminopeptidase